MSFLHYTLLLRIVSTLELINLRLFLEFQKQMLIFCLWIISKVVNYLLLYIKRIYLI